MARALTLAVFCLCLAITLVADLRRLIADRAAGIAPKVGADGKPLAAGASGDLDTASSWGWGGPGFYGGGPWGGWGGGPWGYGYGWGGYGGWGGGYGGWGGWW